MVGVLIEGGFGNQLFQLSFILVAAKKNNTSYVIITNSSYKYEIFNYFRLYPFQGKINKIKKYIFINHFNFNTIVYNNWVNPEINLRKQNNNTLYKGFFQSELYFKEYKSYLLKTLKIKKKYVNEFKKKYSKFFKENKTAVVHIRRKDYLIYGNDKLGGKGLNLPMSYYEKFLRLPEINKQTKIIFISDDIEYVEKHFGNKKNFFFENNEMIIDFQILMNADIVCLANSTFSWWGAYLNKKKNKVVYVPEFWLGFKIKKEYPHSIISEGWEIINMS